jgi:hypothetical protein
MKDVVSKAHEIIDRIDRKQLIIDPHSFYQAGTYTENKVDKWATRKASLLSMKIEILYALETKGAKDEAKREAARILGYFEDLNTQGFVKEGVGSIKKNEELKEENEVLRKERDEAVEGYLVEKGHREQAEAEIQRLVQFYASQKGS